MKKEQVQNSELLPPNFELELLPPPSDFGLLSSDFRPPTSVFRLPSSVFRPSIRLTILPVRRLFCQSRQSKQPFFRQ